MAGLFDILWLAILGTRDIKESKDKNEALSEPPYIAPETGQPVYRDHRFRLYGKNGEKLEPRYLHAPNGSLRIQQVGTQSGTVYEDDYLRKLKFKKSQEKDNLEKAKEKGELAYLKYYENYGRFLTTEISTDKIIVALEEISYKGIYRKFYHKSTQIGKYSVTYSEPDDFGVPITKYEYDKLNILGGTHSKHSVVSNLIGTAKDTYYDTEDKYLYEKVDGDNRIGEKCKIYTELGEYVCGCKNYSRVIEGIVKNVENNKFVVRTNKGTTFIVKPCAMVFLGKDESKMRCIVNDKGVEQYGVVKKIENGKYLVELKDGSMRYVSGMGGHIKFIN